MDDEKLLKAIIAIIFIVGIYLLAMYLESPDSVLAQVYNISRYHRLENGKK
jgi:multisubunit Na+/H+ antiporter MnhB subunit